MLKVTVYTKLQNKSPLAFNIIDTVRIVRGGPGLCNGTVSVPLSVPSIDPCSSVRRVC